MKHSNVVVVLDNGTDFRFVDPRTFGFVAVFTPQELDESSIGRLGRDALTDLPRVAELTSLLEGRQAPIKALLLDQNLLAGLGNIYADETSPPCGGLPAAPRWHVGRRGDCGVAQGNRADARHALKWGGTSLDDLAYLLPDGRTGDYLGRLRVYGKEGQRCCRCGGEIVRTIVRNRSSYWCPACQV